MAKGYENLIPVTERTKEEARALSIKGGKKSGETRRAQKTFKDTAKMILAMQLSEKEKGFLKKMGVSMETFENTKKALLVYSVLQKAVSKGDSQTMMRLAELTGEHIDEKKISVGGETGNRTVINIVPKGGVGISIQPKYVKGSAYGTDKE